MPTADFLLIDIGNTAVKLRRATATDLPGRTRRMPTATLLGRSGAAALRTALVGWAYERVIISSVVPAGTKVALRVWPRATVIGARTDTGVDLRGYPGRRTLGADRIANAAGALARHGPGPLVVVDFGTAATFNALDGQGRFLGGAIAPGLAAMRESLPAKTAQLPVVRLTRAAPVAIGRSTVGALRAGTLIGYRGLVREILAAFQDELGGRARVVATGGDARFLAARDPAFFDAVDPELTLHGLQTIAVRLFGSGNPDVGVLT